VVEGTPHLASTIAATMAIEDARRFDLAIDLSYQCWLLNI
jgi:hypothetical protein